MLGEQATAADIAQLRASYGLDKPLPVQFAYWLKELARGNLGQSIFLQRPVTQALWERAEPTLFLTLFSIAIATADRRSLRHRLGGLARPRDRPGRSPGSRCWAPASRASGSA